MRLSTARVGKEPYVAGAQAIRLQTRRRLRGVEGQPVGVDAQHGDTARSPAARLVSQTLRSLAQLGSVDIPCAPGRPTHQVRDPEPEVEQKPFLVRFEQSV